LGTGRNVTKYTYMQSGYVNVGRREAPVIVWELALWGTKTLVDQPPGDTEDTQWLKCKS